jgi:hypothetical protein
MFRKMVIIITEIVLIFIEMVLILTEALLMQRGDADAQGDR